MGVGTYTFTITADPFTETNFVGGNVIASDSGDAHEPFVGYSSNGSESEPVRKVDIASAAEFAGTTTVFFAGTH